MKKRIRLKRILYSILISVIVLLVGGLLFLPLMAKNYLNKNGKELAGRTLHIDKLKLNYFTSTARVIGFQYYEANESDIFFEFDTFLVDLKPLKLLSDEIYIQKLQLVNSNGRIIQNGDEYNFSDLLEFFTPDSIAGEELNETPDQTGYKLNLHEIELSRGSLSYTDKQLDHTINIRDLSFLIPQIHWNKPDSSNAAIEFKLPNGGEFSGALNYNVDAGSFTGKASVDRFELETFLPYLQQYLKASDVDGTLSGEISFSGDQDNLEELAINGIAAVDSFVLKDVHNRKVLGAQQGTVVLNLAEPLKQKMDIDLVEFQKPYVYFALLDSLSNFEKMLVLSDEINEATMPLEEVDSTGGENPMEISVNRFCLNDGLLDFSDQRYREEFCYELSEIQVDMDTLEIQNSWVNISANMKLNKRGTLEAQIGMNPFSILDSIRLDYVLKDFQLPDLNMYSKEYVGLPILFGDMYYVNSTSIVNKQITSKNKLIIRDVEMGRKSGGLYDLPVKLALFILKDKNGDIVMDIPVTGDLSDPETRIGPIVWNTLKGFMLKIVASPFKLFGNMLGADSKDLEEINFNYGDSVLVRKQTKSLDLLLKLEKEKPELQIDLQYLNDKKLERTDVARVLSHQFFLQERDKKAGMHRKEYLKFLKEKTGQDSLVIQDYEMLLVPATMIDSVIALNETTRLESIRNYLGAKNDSTTIRVFGFNDKEVQNIGSRPKFIIKYTLAEEREE